MSSLRIYTVYHTLPGLVDLPPNDGVNVPFVVGPAGVGNRPMQHDEGDLPATFAGMRCQFDIWKRPEKHAPLPDYLGFQSYRRRFIAVPPLGFDVAIMERMTFKGKTIAQQYAGAHRLADWEAMVAVLRDITGHDNGVDNPWLAPCCHWVIRRGLFDEFMHFWWTICRRLIPVLKVPTEGYQTRLFDFLSDRIFTIWLVRRGLEVIDLPVEFRDYGVGGRNEGTAV